MQQLNNETAPLPTKTAATTISSLSSGQELQQQPPTSKLLQFLLNEHDNVREIFQHYQFDVKSLEDRLSCVKQICSILRNHMLLEEKVLYPVIRSKVKDGEFMYDRLMLDDLQTREGLILAEHHAKNATVNTVEFDKLVTKLIVNELEHLQEEEETVIPALEKAISKEESDQLHLQLQQMKMMEQAEPQKLASRDPERKPMFKMMLPLRYVTDKGGNKAILTTIGGQQVPYGPASILSNLAIGRMHQNETYVNALKQQGIHSLWDMWQYCLTNESRLDMHKKTGIPIDELDKLVQRIDLMRVKGVGMDYSELLVTAGIFSVGALACSDPVELVKAIDAANQLMKLPKQPTLEVVKGWIKRASQMHDLLESEISVIV